MITINGQAVPSPSVLQVSSKPVSGQRDYNALGNLVRDNMGTKHVVDMTFMHLSGDEAQVLCTQLQVQGDIVLACPTPLGDREITCCLTMIRSSLYRRGDGGDVWANIAVTLEEV